MSDMLSQAEIDALLNGTGTAAASDSPAGSAGTGDLELTPVEMDALAEIGNISMGTSATTLSSLLSQKVSITTPKVEIMAWDELVAIHAKPYVAVKVQYTAGLVGTNLLILNVDDVKVIANLMMGSETTESDGQEISELHLSAISEAMNQMVGSSSTSLSTMTGKKIDISPPEANFLDFSTEDRNAYTDIYGGEKVVKISFRMVIGNFVDSEIMQVLPVSFAKELAGFMLGTQSAPQQASAPQPQASSQPQQINVQQNFAPAQNDSASQFAAASMRMPEPEVRQPVNVQPAQFQSLEDAQFLNEKENIGIIMDVPLQVTVELGRTMRLIREVLEFGPGSIVELDKLAGEPVDILVNGKIIAKGEVVVIDESFGVRITDIVHPSKRL